VTEAVSPEVRDMQGVAALPRENGELVFDAPWQGRVFGLALGLVESLDLPWAAFQARLVDAIASDPDRPYYDSWLAALEALVDEHGIASSV
jgi:nitrile hydratase accessory protein